MDAGDVQASGVTRWQAAKWVGTLDDTGDHEISGRPSTATTAQCRALRVRCVERSELEAWMCAGEERGPLGYRAVLESGALNSGFNGRRGV